MFAFPRERQSIGTCIHLPNSKQRLSKAACKKPALSGKRSHFTLAPMSALLRRSAYLTDTHVQNWDARKVQRAAKDFRMRRGAATNGSTLVKKSDRGQACD